MNPTGGYLDNALKAYNYTTKSRQPQNENVADDFRAIQIDDGYSDDQAENDLLFLKSIVVNDRNMEEIKLKLTKTASYRKKLLNKNELNLRVNFPYFYMHPQLVSRLLSPYFYYFHQHSLFSYRFLLCRSNSTSRINFRM